MGEGALSLTPLGHPAEGEKESSPKQAHNSGSHSSPWLSHRPSCTPVKSKSNCSNGAMGCEYAKASRPSFRSHLDQLARVPTGDRPDGSDLYAGVLTGSVPSALF